MQQLLHEMVQLSPSWGEGLAIYHCHGAMVPCFFLKAVPTKDPTFNLLGVTAKDCLKESKRLEG